MDDHIGPRVSEGEFNRGFFCILVLLVLTLGSKYLTPGGFKNSSYVLGMSPFERFDEATIGTVGRIYSLRAAALEALTNEAIPSLRTVEKGRNYAALLRVFLKEPLRSKKTFVLVATDEGWWLGYRLRGDIPISAERSRRSVLAGQFRGVIWPKGEKLSLYGSASLADPPRTSTGSFYREEDDVVWLPLFPEFTEARQRQNRNAFTTIAATTSQTTSTGRA